MKVSLQLKKEWSVLYDKFIGNKNRDEQQRIYQQLSSLEYAIESAEQKEKQCEIEQKATWF